MADYSYRRIQESLQRLKALGENPLAVMVDSVLARQNKDVSEVAIYCAVPRWFNIELISSLATSPLMTEQAKDILDEISSWTFVKELGNGRFAYRDEVRRHLLDNLRRDDPVKFGVLNKSAHAYFDQKIGRLAPFDEMAWTKLNPEELSALREKLYHLLQIDPDGGFDLFAKLFRGAHRLWLQGEAATILRFVKELGPNILSSSSYDELSYFEAVQENAEGNVDSAVTKLQELLKRSSNQAIQAQALTQLGLSYAASKRYDLAIQSFLQAQKIWDFMQRTHESAILSNNLGNVFLSKSDFKQSEKYFQNALTGLQKTGTSIEQAQTLNNLGNLYARKEELKRALEFYTKSMAIKKEIGDQFGAATTQANIGSVYQRLSQDAQDKKKEIDGRKSAIENYEQCIIVFRRLGARSRLALGLYKLAVLYFQANQIDQTRKLLPEAMEIFNSLRLPELEGARILAGRVGIAN